MVEINETNMIEKMIYSINDFKDEMVKSMNFIREDIRDLKGELKGEINDLRQELRDYKEENNKRWEENNKRWEENNKRWVENNKRWEENNRRWDENNKRWEKYEENRKQDRKELFGILHNYDIAISTQLGDPNAEKMRKIV